MKTYKLAYIKDGDVLEWSCQADNSRHAIEQLHDAEGKNIRIILCKPDHTSTSDLMRMYNMPY
jgi:hypothetical protein